MPTHSVKLETLPWSRNFPVLTPPRSVTLYSTSLLVHSAWESMDAEAFVVWNDFSAKQRNTQFYNIRLRIFSHTSIISRSLLLLLNRKLCYSLTSCNAWFFSPFLHESFQQTILFSKWSTSSFPIFSIANQERFSLWRSCTSEVRLQLNSRILVTCSPGPSNETHSWGSVIRWGELM